MARPTMVLRRLGVSVSIRARTRTSIAKRSFVARILSSMGLDVRLLPKPQAVTNQRTWDFYSGCLEWMLAARGQLNIVQIGANDGRIDDPIYEFVMRHRERTTVLLCEPQPELSGILRDNYRDHPGAHIFEGAIGARPGTLTMYRIHPRHWDDLFGRDTRGWPSYREPTGKGSSDLAYATAFARKHVRSGIDPASVIQELNVPVARLGDAISAAQVPQIVDVLQVDTEGADDEVVYAAVTSDRRPTLINLETRWLDAQRMNRLTEFLESCGYDLHQWTSGELMATLDPNRR